MVQVDDDSVARGLRIVETDLSTINPPEPVHGVRRACDGSVRTR
jgi:hypothetical protein